MTNRSQGTGRRATEAEIDRAIDVVSRQMTEGSSPAGRADFRHRVLARVESGDAPRPAWRAAFVLSPLAVAAAIVMAIFVARGFRLHDVSVDRRSQAEPVQPPARGPALRQAEDAPSSPRDPLSRRGGARLQPGEQRSPVASRYTDVQNALDALAAPSLDVAPLTVDALTPDPIQIDRLDAIAPITVAPLDITDVQRRNE